MTTYTERPMEGAAQKAWDYAVAMYGTVRSLAFIVGCRQKGFWHVIMKNGASRTFLNSTAVQWWHSR